MVDICDFDDDFDERTKELAKRSIETEEFFDKCEERRKPEIMSEEDKKRQKTFVWLVHQMKDCSPYYDCQKSETLPQLSDEYFDEGMGYDACYLAEKGKSSINIDGVRYELIKAMAPIFIKRKAERKAKFERDDRILLVVSSKKSSERTAPLRGSERTKFLLNVYGKTVKLDKDAKPCDVCYSYGTNPPNELCSVCSIIDDEEREEEFKEWSQVNKMFFDQHKHHLSSPMKRMFARERDPYMQMMYISAFVRPQIETELEKKPEPIVSIRPPAVGPLKERSIFKDDDFPPLA